MKRVIVTRPQGQAADLVDRLGERGIGTLAVPAVSIAPPDGLAMARIVEELEGADWLVITSANGAAALAGALDGRGLPAAVRVAAVGPATAAALREVGVEVDAMPADYLTVAIADALGSVEGMRVVLARADSATPQLRQALIARGALVEEVVAYRTIEAPSDSRELLRIALDASPDAVLFTSGSTVRGLLTLAPPQRRQRLTCLPAICIGPVTAEAARHGGFVVGAIASEHTAAGLARATVAHLTKEDR